MYAMWILNEGNMEHGNSRILFNLTGLTLAGFLIILFRLSTDINRDADEILYNFKTLSSLQLTKPYTIYILGHNK